MLDARKRNPATQKWSLHPRNKRGRREEEKGHPIRYVFEAVPGRNRREQTPGRLGISAPLPRLTQDPGGWRLQLTNPTFLSWSCSFPYRNPLYLDTDIVCACQLYYNYVWIRGRLPNVSQKPDAVRCQALLRRELTQPRGSSDFTGCSSRLPPGRVRQTPPRPLPAYYLFFFSHTRPGPHLYHLYSPFATSSSSRIPPLGALNPKCRMSRSSVAQPEFPGKVNLWRTLVRSVYLSSLA